MNKKLFSIIVPIYNAEKYLKECMDSILNQTEKDFELILVNDGSEDNSKEICMYYCTHYENIKYLEIPNSGVSVARNKGIDAAEGEYLLFCDSDDYWSPKLIETIKPYAITGVYDMINFGHCVDRYERGMRIGSYTRSVPEIMEISEGEWKEKFRYYWNSDIGKLAVWDKAIRRKMIINEAIRYHCGQVILEDFEFVIQNWSICKKIILLPEILYHFRANVEDIRIVRRNQNNSFPELDYTLHRLEKFLNKNNVTDNDFPEKNRFVFDTYLIALDPIRVGKTSLETTKNILKSLFECQNFFECGKSFMGKRIQLLKILVNMKLYRLAEWYVKTYY